MGKEKEKVSETKDHTKASCKIMGCSCAHAYQDRKYGRNQRVHNPRRNGLGVGYTCTVCGTKR